MSDDELFEIFMAISAKRRAEHESNLHQDCTGCKVGLKWTEQEDLLLISLLQPHCLNLMRLSKELDRPIWGVAARLQKLGLISRRQGVYRPNFTIYKAKVSSHLITESLIEKGWYNVDSTIRSPLWWIQTTIRTGKGR